MSESNDSGLLPTGMRDSLPPGAAAERAMEARLLECFARHGYAEVRPPLVEFEDSLLAGIGGFQADSMFRLMDPISHRMMGVRPDMTQQVARIATTRLGEAPRPLRLSYAGPVLRVAGGQLRSEREFSQVGVELIGAAELAADIEVIRLAVSALEDAGLSSLSVDLTMPRLVPVICEALGLEQEMAEQVRLALDAKDGPALKALGTGHEAFFAKLLDAAGVAEEALADLAALNLQGAPAQLVARLEGIVNGLQAGGLHVPLTIDPGESRGFEYHLGFGFTVYARGVRGELARGGRYEVQAQGEVEPSVGFSVFSDSLMRAAPKAGEPPLVLAPFEAAADEVAALRRSGHRVIQALAPVGDLGQEARRLGCTQILADGGVTDLQD